MEKKRNVNAVSPLYTAAALKKAKQEFLACVGKDLDGAYRIENRKDGQVFTVGVAS